MLLCFKPFYLSANFVSFAIWKSINILCSLFAWCCTFSCAYFLSRFIFFFIFYFVLCSFNLLLSFIFVFLSRFLFGFNANNENISGWYKMQFQQQKYEYVFLSHVGLTTAGLRTGDVCVCIFRTFHRCELIAARNSCQLLNDMLVNWIQKKKKKMFVMKISIAD